MHALIRERRQVGMTSSIWKMQTSASYSASGARFLANSQLVVLSLLPGVPDAPTIIVKLESTNSILFSWSNEFSK